MKHYLWIFTGAYTAALIVFGIISTFISIGSSSGAPTLMVGGFFTAWHFVKREKRIPTADEKIQLIWGSIACTFIISALLVFIFALARCQKSLFLTNTGLRTDFAGQRF